MLHFPNTTDSENRYKISHMKLVASDEEKMKFVPFSILIILMASRYNKQLFGE